MNTHTAPLDPRIGMLNGGRFYAFLDGYDKPETTGPLEEIQRALAALDDGRPVTALVVVAKPVRALRDFAVTITPRVTTYSGSSTIGEHTVTITARTAAEAVSEARRRYREAEGRERVPATFTAKLAD